MFILLSNYFSLSEALLIILCSFSTALNRLLIDSNSAIIFHLSSLVILESAFFTSRSVFLCSNSFCVCFNSAKRFA
ncbi:MAG: hypothetical protein O7D30_12970 [Rickettsia endosymbiont of Ixodes persulcatus]|nr:hypothetical protein [Rickettsia endosymbiont of Ixodes persulcatus]MCZ6911038.1 hypothetical protein [Rickettsia endosymbiont of Ixodes persulcatus]MCZ6926082.1 hypothetical protein [Rickettsia endosymbiont of Ixodes persulcatus]